MEKSRKMFATLFIVAAGLFLGTAIFGNHGWWPEGLRNEVHFKGGIFYGAFLAMFVGVMWGTEEGMKYHSPQLVADNFRTNWNDNDRPIPAGEYDIRRTGGIHALGMSLPGSSGLFISHRIATRTKDDSTIAEGIVRPYTLDEIPAKLRDTIKRERLPGTKRIWFLTTPMGVERQGREVAQRELEFMDINREQSRYEEMNARLMQSTSRITGGVAGMVQAINPTPAERIRNIISRPPKPAHDEDDYGG